MHPRVRALGVSLKRQKGPFTKTTSLTLKKYLIFLCLITCLYKVIILIYYPYYYFYSAIAYRIVFK
jgi:hypothetical protein